VQKYVLSRMPSRDLVQSRAMWGLRHPREVVRYDPGSGAGLSGQFSPLGVYFNNPKTTDPNGPNFWNGFGFFSSWGGFAGGTSKGPGRVCSTENGDRTGVLGGVIGAGVGVFWTNAEHASELQGPFHTWNISGGWGLGADFSLGWDDSGHVYVSGMPEGAGGVALSTYPTTTNWTWP
jgi:hypothetical protein